MPRHLQVLCLVQGNERTQHRQIKLGNKIKNVKGHLDVAAWVSPPLIVVACQPHLPCAQRPALLAPQNVSNSQKRTRTCRRAERISSSGASGTAIPLVRGVKVPSRHSVPGRRAHKQGHRLWMKLSRVGSGRSYKYRPRLRNVCVFTYTRASHTCTCIHVFVCVCVCVYVSVPSRKTLTSGACQRFQGLCSHY